MRVDAFGVVRELMIEQLQGTIAFAGCSEPGDAVAHVGLGLGPSAGDEGLLGRNAGGAELEYRRAVSGWSGGDGYWAGGKFELVELDRDRVEGREVAAEASMPARLLVRLKSDDAAFERGVLRHDKFPVGVNGMHQVSFDGLTDFDWIMTAYFDLEACPFGEDGRAVSMWAGWTGCGARAAERCSRD